MFAICWGRSRSARKGLSFWVLWPRRFLGNVFLFSGTKWDIFNIWTQKCENCGGRVLFFSWMVWIYKKTRVIPDSCDVLIARNEEESHIEHLVPTKTPQKMKTPPTKSPSERNWERCLPAFVFDGGFAGWWKRRSISTPLPGGNPLKSRRKWNFFMFVSSFSL